ncbi:MAG: hypothetical protein EOO54_27050, partial [Haliea sp.]
MRNWLNAMTLCAATLLAGVVAGPAAAQQAKTDAAPVLTLRGDETPETVRKLVDALSAGGRKVEIRIAGKGEAAAAPAAPASALAAGTGVAVASSAPAEHETPAEAFWDHFVDGVTQGLGAMPRLAQIPDAWRTAWAQNRNGSAGWWLVVGLVLAFAVAGLFRLTTKSWFTRRLQPQGLEFTPRLIASSWGLLQDLATLGLWLAVLHAVRRFGLPEPDLAHMVLRTIANGLTIGAGYLILGRFLLAPGASERRVMPLPRAERAFKFLIFFGILTPVLLTATVSIQHATGPGTVVGLFALVGIVSTLFKVWWFIDARHDLAALILGSAHEPGPARRVIALTTGWLYAALAVLIWMVGNASSMMEGGARWAEAAALTQFIIVLAPILAVGVTSLMACRQAHAA